MLPLAKPSPNWRVPDLSKLYKVLCGNSVLGQEGKRTDSAAVASAATSKDEAMAVMEEEDLDAVADAWGADEELIPGAPTEGLDEEMEGFENGAEAQGDEDEEGGWDMEVHLAVRAVHPACSNLFQGTDTNKVQRPL